jgi:transposase
VAALLVGFHKGTHGLAALAAEVLGEDPFSGAVLVFRAKRADSIKILTRDGSGLVLVWMRMPQGSFRWPPVTDGIMRLSAFEFAVPFDGLDWTRVQAVRRVPAPTRLRRLAA